MNTLKPKIENSNQTVSDLPFELQNSLYKIVSYSEIEEDKADTFIKNVEKFVKTYKNKNSENDIRKIKRDIETTFFLIYEKVLKKVILENNSEKLYNMFLNYGYMDERLLSTKHIMQLYNIEVKSDSNYRCNIYTMRQWMEAIYIGDREPSVDDFDMDYYDAFRELKKRKLATDKDKDAYEHDQDGKLNFEIQHMLKGCQRLCCAQGSLYFPILYEDLTVGDLDRAFVSPEQVENTVKGIVDIDFSLFYREIFCHDPERGLEKEYIMKEIMPDIILVPTFGVKSLMWQPIANRDRINPSRFLIPIFTAENLENMIIGLAGSYRWEYCKTNMGVDWADITHKSLTSEYADYIQFYKKNSELSQDTKEKVKNQISKNRNMLRSIFTSDYELWIKYESKGAIRLNKVTRNIMFVYCPFSKEIRQSVVKQAAFLKPAQLYERICTQKIKVLNNKINKLSKTKSGVPEELEQNLAFYRDK